MKELIEGYVSNVDLADWFNIGENTIKKKKKDYLIKLQDYCDFESVRGGVNIINVRIGVYERNKNYRVIKDNFCSTWSSTGLDSCKRVSAEIYDKHKQELTIAPDTAYRYTRNARNQFYGKPMSKQRGEKGTCIYIWCKKNETGYCELLTPEEEQIKQQLFKEMFGDIDEKVIIVEDMVQRGELKESEAYAYLREITEISQNYSSFIFRFKEKTGIQLIRGTLIENTICFEEDE